MKAKIHKCIAKNGVGKRCNKPTKNNSSFCKDHQSKKNLATNKKAPRNKKLGIASLIITIVFGIFAVIAFVIGPSKENQESIKTELKEHTKKIDWLIAQLNPDSSTYKSDKEKRENDNLELSRLETEVNRLRKDSIKNKESINDLMRQLDSLKTLRIEESQNLTLKYRNVNFESGNYLEAIFRYGYATIQVDAVNKIKIIDLFQPNPDLLSVNWNGLGVSVNKDYLTIKIPEILFKSSRLTFGDNSEQIDRRYNDIGNLYFTMAEEGRIQNAIMLLADNREGTIVVVGFVDRNDFQKQKSRVVEYNRLN